MNAVAYFFLAIVAVAFAAPQQPAAQPPIPILKFENEGINVEDGSYKWAYETGNEIQAEESGYVKNPNTDDAIQVAQGSYSYVAPDGQRITVTYVADENGFVPQVKITPR